MNTYIKRCFVNLFILLSISLNSLAQNEIFMSSKGSDESTGTIDQPVRSFEKARELVRKIKKENNENINVYLREGEYFIDKTVVFGLEDGGDDHRIITWQAFKDEHVVISSGIKLDNWKKSIRLKGLLPQAKAKVFEANLPEVINGVPRCLFKGDKMLERSRMKGFKSRIDAFNRDGLEYMRSFNIMYVDDKAELKNWNNVSDLELVVRPWCLWTMNNLPIESVDLENRSIKTQVEATYFLTKERYNRFPDEHAWIENSLEGMIEPGTWCVNTKTSKVYYWPEEDIPGNDIIVPSLQEFFLIEGYNDLIGRDDIPVKGLVFKNLVFKHNDRYDFEKDDSGIQHDWELFDKDNAFVRFRGAENCAIEACELSSGGGVGIRLDLYCRNITVKNNYIHDIGSTGIFLGGYGLGTKDVNTKNIIHNNKISNAGKLYWHNTAITLSQTSENLISHNEISSMPYSGMVITGYRPWFKHESRKNFLMGTDSLIHYNLHGGPSGFTVGLWIRENSKSVRWNEIGKPLMGPVGSVSPTWDSLYFFKVIASDFTLNHNRQNIIEYNEIFNVMTKLGDGNGIYISDAGPMNTIRYNFIHSSPKAWGVGIRTDAFQMNSYVFGNIIWDFSGGIATSANNIAMNNIVASCRDMGLSEEPGKHLDFYFDYNSTTTGFTDGFVMRNVIWHDGISNPYFRMDLSKGKPGHNVVDYNFYYWKEKNDEMAELLETFHSLGMEINGMQINPMFSDPENGDFTLLPDSPLLKNGFVNIDQSKMGLSVDYPDKFQDK